MSSQCAQQSPVLFLYCVPSSAFDSPSKVRMNSSRRIAHMSLHILIIVFTAGADLHKFNLDWKRFGLYRKKNKVSFHIRGCGIIYFMISLSTIWDLFISCLFTSQLGFSNPYRSSLRDSSADLRGIIIIFQISIRFHTCADSVDPGGILMHRLECITQRPGVVTSLIGPPITIDSVDSEEFLVITIQMIVLCYVVRGKFHYVHFRCFQSRNVSIMKSLLN